MKLLAALFVFLLIGFAVFWLGVGALVAPFNRADQGDADLAGEPYLVTDSIKAADGTRISLWHHPAARPDRGCVLLLHGNGGSHRQFDDLARVLIEEGYGVSAIDFRGHGASAAVRRSVGWDERLDAEAAYRDLCARCPGRKIGVLGFSLGEAAALLGNVAKEADALVLDAVYKDVGDAVHVRFEQALGGVPAAILTPLTLGMAELRYGLRRADLVPAYSAIGLETPTLAFAGEEDRYAPVADSEAILNAATGQKRLVAVPGAAHGANRYMLGKEYDRLVLEHFVDHISRSAD